ncbi:MAG TPA: hypothetical protein VHI95_17515 [Acidimicrobiales bacterium]|jgi:hypothetical protein|nr:hypothetical protein [Acidimicrobiales bacterium]
MPFCDDCAKFWSPNSMPPTGECPTCGRQIASPQEVVEASEYRAPWHFKLMIVLAAAYLLWRLVQMIQWVV